MHGLLVHLAVGEGSVNRRPEGVRKEAQRQRSLLFPVREKLNDCGLQKELELSVFSHAMCLNHTDCLQVDNTCVSRSRDHVSSAVGVT